MTNIENGTLTFRELGLSESTLQAIESKGYVNPTPIQAACIPLLLGNEKDIIGRAQTGTGKTAAFGLPLIELLEEQQPGGSPQALILAPTRELAIQVAEEIISFKGSKKLFVTTVYGGASMTQQLKDLRKGTSIVVGTPGRVLDHLHKGSLRLENLSHLVLDEADEMLNMGFIDDIREILSHAPDEKRMLLFSATMPPDIRNIAREFMGPYDEVAVAKQQMTNSNISQVYYEVSEADKLEALVRLMEIEKDFYGLIFCQTKVETDNVANKLIERGYAAEALHGDISQHQRERILSRFKGRSINILVATDVAARGIDINNLTHVFNFGLPQDPESYVHRIGRTGRAGRKGTAVSFISPREFRRLALVKRVAKAEIVKGKLPGVKEVIDAKVGHIKEEVSKLLVTEEVEYGKFSGIAAELLELGTPEEVLAAVLKISYEDDLDEKSFNKISEGGFFKDKGDRREGGKGRRGGYSDGGGAFGERKRLFIALGKLDKINGPREMASYLERETGVPGKFIHEIRVTDKFSFASVSERDAMQIMEKLNGKSRNKKTMVEIAKN
ncbi:MAG: DEAD/DEAH box helicase [Bacteroidia bacterium]|nr:DEAD/DEAH box helicase [Bacteroidia bacterium]